MKKALVLCSLCLMQFLVVAQSASTFTTITDTLHYFFNKHYFKTGDIPDNFPYYKSPAASNTLITQVGSKFQNSDTIIVTGLEALVRRMTFLGAPMPRPVHIYLCELDAQKLPVWPALDSVVANITFTNGFHATEAR